MRPRSALLVAALAAAVPMAPLAAQAATQPAAPTSPPTSEAPTTFYNSVAIDAVLLPFGVYSAEFEHAHRNGFSFGVGGSYIDPVTSDDDEHDAWIEGKLLYYPSENGIRGFSIGLTAGYEWAYGVPSDIFTLDNTPRHDAAPTIGVILDYNKLLGRRKRFLFGIGGGAKRVLPNVDSATSPLLQVYPTGRLMVGYAF